MNFVSSSSSVRPASLYKRLTAALAICALAVTVGCADAATPADQSVDASLSPAFAGYDAGTAGFAGYDAGTPGFAGYDAGIGVVPAFDAGKPSVDASTAPTDASTAPRDAATDGGSAFPDLGGLFPKTDAGPAPTTDAGAGVRNVKGPCKDLNLLCFDFVDMWIINPSECGTCNNGKGCQGCAIPYAY